LAWVLGFAVVSAAADMVNEGARSEAGPLLVRLISGGTEAMVLLQRSAFASPADRSGRRWTLALAGCQTTVICVPALASPPFVGGVGPSSRLHSPDRANRQSDTQLGQDSILSAGRRIVGLVRGFVTYNALDQVAPSLAPACHSSGRGRLAVAFSIVRFVAVG
jgi:hypothetical protein